MTMSDDAAGRRGEVVLIVAGGELAERAINYLSAHFANLVVLREQPETKWQIIKRRTRLLGPLQAWGQVAAGLVIRVIGRLSARRARELRGAVPSEGTDHAVRIIDVGSVNSDRCRRLLYLLSPKVVAVYGARIISQRTLDAIDAPFINYHAGITPQYRGQHPAYWARVEGDEGNAGVTVHLVDKGVDTGDVIYQAPVSFAPSDSIATYQYVQLKTGMELMAKAVGEALAGRLRTHEVAAGPSKVWFPPTIWQYLWNGIVKGVW